MAKPHMGYKNVAPLALVAAPGALCTNSRHLPSYDVHLT